ncbi:MAG: tRNA (guanosine(37)-N1)-methyltransferase TrmD [Bacilli bacterium]
MKITVLTLFPEMFSGIIENSIVKRALAKGIFTLELVNIRDYTKDKYHRVDTPPIGGGAGLIMKCQPIVDALSAHASSNAHIILTSPKGRTFKEDVAKEFATYEHLIIICGHYEGIDARIENFIDEEVSVGDYILTGGEIPAMAIIDATMRLLQGAIAGESTIDESFEFNLLEYPQYTEPKDFAGYVVPPILYSGNHALIDKYRYKKSLQLTKKYRPDLFSKLELSAKDLALLEEEDNSSWEVEAIKKSK